MAGAVNWERLRELASFRAEKGCAISLYLDLDPRAVPARSEAHPHVNALLDAAARGLDRGDLTHGQRVALDSDLERIRSYFAYDFDREGAHGFALFASSLDNVWLPLPLAQSVPDAVKINDEFFLTPLIPLVGRGEGALLAAVGRERGDLYRYRAGRLEELADRTEEQPGRHDQGGRSQARYQRHIEELVSGHLRRVAELLDQRVRRHGQVPIVVVVSEETRAEFAGLLSNEVRRCVAGWTQAEAHAGPAELLELALPVLEGWRERREHDVLERWREESGRKGRAAAGWGDTLEAASDGRIELLLYQSGAGHEVWRCPACGRLMLATGKCPLDGTALEHRDEGLDLAVHQTLAHGGSVWAVSHAHDLEPVGGVGAILRY